MNRIRPMAVILVMLLGMSFHGISAADEGGRMEEIKLAPSADTFISSRNHDGEKNKNFGSKEKLKVVRGKKEESGSFRGWKGALIRFDVSKIPGNAEVQEARLFLYHYNHEGEPISIHRMEKDWAELGANWVEPCKGCEPWWGGWGEGNYLKEAADAQRVKKKGWYSWDVTGDVRSFLKGAKNYGWFLRSARTWGSDSEATKFYSKESHHKNRRPYLRVRYRSSIPPLTVKITSPPNGAILHESPVSVTGTVSDPSATVSVNDMVPSISGNTFQASIPLIEGKNTITAKASDQYGQTASDSLEVTLITKGAVAGLVKDSSTGLPLPAALVAVTDSSNQSHSALTGADGRYEISGIVSGGFNGGVKKEGYRPHTFSGKISPGQTHSFDFDLTPILPVISGISVSDLTTNSASINWTTDMSADSLVEYGLTSSYGTSAEDSSLKTAHKINLQNLTPDTTYHFRVTSRNVYGFASVSGDNSFKTPALSNPITLTIISPKDGDTIARSDVRVEGTMTNSLGIETGVVVNGIVAQVYGNQFSANHVPLVEGSNPINVKATDVKGNTQTGEITVNAVRAEHYIRITANIDSGIVPLEVVLRLDSSLDLANASLTYTGPGEVELLSREGNEYRFRIATEGSYSFLAQVSGSSGKLYEDTVAILVMSKFELENRLGNKWEGMKASLLGGSIEAALDYFALGSKDRYRQVFLELGEDRIRSIFSNIIQVKLYSLSERFATGGVLRQGSGGVYSYPVTFMLDENGIWKIMGF